VRLRLLIGSLLSGILACTSPVELSHSYAAYDPPAWYAAAWRETMECAAEHIRQPFYSRVRFYIVDTPDAFKIPDGRRVWAIEQKQHIWIAKSRVDDSWTVKHEMLHAMTQYNTHPQVFDKCGLKVRI
jgi:hypothetical protein